MFTNNDKNKINITLVEDVPPIPILYYLIKYTRLLL